uniref:Elicitin-like protein 2 n=1 Tax=Pythium oligandrum TaxID=41045 RepID=ELI2_PYTOL|nr:RecName: Full=Elicitin-like protein 2; Flags: Precursor [Pythium oligandrum]BAE95200.1 elicitin-like protein1 [Pythium oligandrum]
MFSKTLVVLAAVAAVTVNGLTAKECQDAFTGEVAKLTTGALPLVQPCSSDSGFSMVPPTGLPTDDQYVKMCASKNCKALLEFIKGAGLKDCELNFGSIFPGSVPLNVYQLGQGFDAKCESISGGGSTPTTAPPSGTTPTTPTTAPPTGTTPGVTPSPTTPKPAC